MGLFLLAILFKSNLLSDRFRGNRLGFVSFLETDELNEHGGKEDVK